MGRVCTPKIEGLLLQADPTQALTRLAGRVRPADRITKLKNLSPPFRIIKTAGTDEQSLKKGI
jgi:hypothetical protein